MCRDCIGPPRHSRRSFLSFSVGVASFGMVGVGQGAGSTVAAAVPSVAVAPGLSIRPRAAWGADLPPQGALRVEEPRFLLVHHTATGNGYGPDEVSGIIRGAYRFHTGPEKGWPDVAYNFFVDRFGGVWEARAGSLAGPMEADATGGSQGFAQLVCLIGDFTSQMPTPEAIDSAARTLAWLADRDGIPTGPGDTVEFVSRGSNRWSAGTTVQAATISGHRDMSATACPGDTFYPNMVANFPALVSKARTTGPAPTSTAHNSGAPSNTSSAVTTQPSVPATSTTTTSSTSTTIPSTTTTTTSTTTARAAPAPIVGGDGGVATGSSDDGVSDLPPDLTADPPPADDDGSAGLVAPLGVAVAAALLAGGLAWRTRRVSERRKSGEHDVEERSSALDAD